MLRKRWTSFFNPEYFQGWKKNKGYFEGWYYKLLNAGTTKAYAIIPGIAFDDGGGGHAFIQVLDGMARTSEYYRFKTEEFTPAAGRLHIRIGENVFTGSGMKIRLPGIQGDLDFSGMVPWPKPFYSPGIMGPYSFIPFMECYHGIISMDHEIQGSLLIQNQPIDFSGGRGYIEKDWGTSFPSAYVWLQTNHFIERDASLKVSVAKIPWRGSSFTGFIAGLWSEGTLYRFTTYNRTKLLRSSVRMDRAEFIMENGRYRLEISAIPEKAASLASPVRGAMEGRIEESMSSRVELILAESKSKRIIFQDTSHRTGLEIAGNIEDICV